MMSVKCESIPGPAARTSAEVLGAHAYSSNGRVAFADTPDLYTQAHEAAHAVQQTALRNGLQLKGGVGAEGDKYEQHADMVANAVVQGKSAETILDRVAGRPTTVVAGMAGTTGPVQMITEQEHKKNVRKDNINKGTFTQRKQRGLLSRSGRHELLELLYEDERSEKLFQLNEQFEIALACELELHATTIARRMVSLIGGFSSFDQAKRFVEMNLISRLEHTEVDVHSRRRINRKRLPHVLNLTEARREQYDYDYSEKNLYPVMTGFFSDRGFDPTPNEYVYGWSDDIEAVNLKLEWLQQFKSQVERVKPTEKNRSIRKHVRKVYNTVKLNHILLSQMGYFGGSMEFKAGIEKDLEFWVYLISTKTRVPKNSLLYPAPKQMLPYKTSKGESRLPYLNQFSIAFGHAELSKAKHIPERERKRLEEARAMMLASLIGKKEHHSYDEVMTAAHGIKTEFDRNDGKNKLKYRYPGNYGDVFYTDIGWIQEAAERARITVVNRYKDREEYAPVLRQWALNLFSDADEMKKWVSTPAYLEIDEDQQYSDKRKMMKDVVFSSGLWVVMLVFIIWQSLTNFKDSLGSSMNMTNSSWDPLNETSLSLNTNLTNSTDIPQFQGLSPLFWIPIMLAFSTLCADVYLLKREMRTASAYAIRTIGRFGPQVSSKIMSAALGLGLTYTVLNLKNPSESPENALNPERAFASALFREFVLFTLNNAVVVALPNMLSYCVSVLASKCGKGSMESKTLQYDDDHIRKVLLSHASRSILISLLTSALQAGGQLSSNPFDSEVIVANLMLHLITELLVDRITISHKWAEKIYGEDARQFMLGVSSKALGHPSFSKKPYQYTHFGRDPRLLSPDENLSGQ